MVEGRSERLMEMELSETAIEVEEEGRQNEGKVERNGDGKRVK